MKKFISIFAVLFLLSWGGTLLADTVQLLETGVSPSMTVNITVPGYTGGALAGVYNLDVDFDPTGGFNPTQSFAGYCVDPALSNATYSLYNIIPIPNATNYLEAAWIFVNFGTPSGAQDAADVQMAIWSVIGGFTFNTPSQWTTESQNIAAAAVIAVEQNDWNSTGGLSLAVSPETGTYNGVLYQDYIIRTPEPASLLLLGLGLFGVGLVGRKKRA